MTDGLISSLVKTHLAAVVDRPSQEESQKRNLPSSLPLTFLYQGLPDAVKATGTYDPCAKELQLLNSGVPLM